MELMDLRDKYIYYDEEIHKHPLCSSAEGLNNAEIIPELRQENLFYSFRGGRFVISDEDDIINLRIPDVKTYYTDLDMLLSLSQNGSVKTFTHTRVHLLENKFDIHEMYNKEREIIEQKVNSFRDFYTVNKVDTHVHHSACMSQ
jgi:hypothetical protein